ncbi:MAG: FAD-dependent monooxygenase, partial [Microbacteriaceae bacterium]
MPAVTRVLVVGAGVAGCAAAILLAESGVDVDLIDAKAEVTTLGSGITLQGNALRAFRQLGVWEEVEANGYSFTTLGLRAPDPDGTLIVEMPDARTGGPDLPATVGMPRPDLARILVRRAEQAGAHVRFGVELAELRQDADGVDVTFANGEEGRYELVIGADGLHSRVRSAIGIDTKPEPTGMAIWRVFTPRPASVTRTDLTYGGPSYIAGYCPTGEDSLYAYIVEDAAVLAELLLAADTLDDELWSQFAERRVERRARGRRTRARDLPGVAGHRRRRRSGRFRRTPEVGGCAQRHRIACCLRCDGRCALSSAHP